MRLGAFAAKYWKTLILSSLVSTKRPLTLKPAAKSCGFI